MSLADILKTLIKPTTRTSADLRADLAKIDIQVLEAKVDAIERQRRELLLRGSDAEVLAITQDLSAANLEAERGQAAVDELTRLISEAEQREAREAIEATASGARDANAQLIGLAAAATAEADSQISECAIRSPSLPNTLTFKRPITSSIRLSGSCADTGPRWWGLPPPPGPIAHSNGA
jgi:hypothetical protein